jgi:hypothetical protein
MGRNPKLPSECWRELASQVVVSIDIMLGSFFFNNFCKVVTREKLGPQAVWNIDETGFTAIHKPGKIVTV